MTVVQPTGARPSEGALTLVEKLAAAALVCVAAVGLLHRLTGDAATGAVASVALLAFLVVGQGALRVRERLLLTTGLVLTAVLIVLDGAAAADTIWRGLEQATFLAAFMVLIGILKDAAVTSTSLRELGRYVTRQPPSRRYGAVALGSAALTALANVGALALLAPLIQAGVAAGRDAGDAPEISAIKERRQICAAQRGFAVVIMWSPTTVTQALLITMFPGADPTTVLLTGLGLALSWLVVGWLEDVLRWRTALRALARKGQMPQRRPPLPAPRRAITDLATVVAALLVLVLAVSQVLDTAVVPALMMVAPLLTLAWIATQNVHHGRPAMLAEVRRRIGTIATRTLPQSSPEAVTLAAAGYIGTMLAAIVPPEAIAWTLEFGPLGRFLVVASLPLAIILLAQFALTPIVVSVFVATAFHELGALPAEPHVMILALAAGWALSLTASQFTAGPLVLRRVSGIDGRSLSWGWNWAYNIAAYLTAVAFLGVLTAFG